MSKELEYCSYLNKQSEKYMKSLHIPTGIVEYKHGKNYTSVFNHEYSENILSDNEKEFISNIKFKKLKLKKVDDKVLTTNYEKRITKIKSSEISSDEKITKLKCAKTKYDKKINNINNVIRSYQISIPFTYEQKNIIIEWFSVCDKVYNTCVDLFNKDSKKFIKYTKKQIFDIIFGSSDKNCPYDMLTGEYNSFMTNLKSAFTNLKQQNITHFEMTHKKQKKGRSILIPKKSISKMGIFVTKLGSIESFDNILDYKNIACDCKLVYDKVYKMFYLHIPQYKKKIIEQLPVSLATLEPVASQQAEPKKYKITALDQGEKTFVACYSPEIIERFGNDIRIKILNRQTQIKKLQKIKAKNINKTGKKIKNKRAISNKIQRLYKNIKNIVKELRNKTVNYLCKTYERILIPEFAIKNMIKNPKKEIVKEKFEGTKDEIKQIIRTNTKKRQMGKKSKFVLQQLSHYKFKQQLLAKGEEYGCQIIECTEEYTSKCCGKCGCLSDKYDYRMKICSGCGTNIDRDVNGSRNILIKNITKIVR